MDLIARSLAKDSSSKTNSLINKLNNVISILEYPIILPEVDDTARLQRFFDDIAVKGKNAVLTKGTYLVSNLITIADKNSFALIGNKDAIIKRAPLYTGTMMKLSNCSDVMIKGLHVDSDDGFGTPAKVVGTYNADSKTYTVNSTNGYNTTGKLYIYTEAGIQSATYTGKTATTFTGVTNYGVIGGGGLSSPMVTDTDVRPIYGSPLYMIGVSDVDITQCLFTGNFNHAASDMISMESVNTVTTVAAGYDTYTATVPTNNVKIYQNTFKNIGEEAVIFRQGCKNIQVTNNYFENVWGTAVTNKGHDSEVSYNTFVNCYFGTEINGEANVFTQGCQATVKGNKFFDCGVPVFMQTTGSKLEAAGRFINTYIVQDNEMYNTKICAVYARHGGRLVLEGNTIKGVTNQLFDFRTTSYGNGNGIYIFNIHGSDISNNRIYDCANEHMWIDSTQNFKVVNNRTQQGGLFTRTKDAFNANATTYSVEATSGYPDAGTFKVSIGGVEQTITYTGRTSTTFTGCTGGDTTAVPVGSFIRDAGTKRHVYMNTCIDYEFTGNKVMNGYMTHHSARHALVNSNKVVNTDATAAILVTGDSYRSTFNHNEVVYARQYGMKFDGAGRIQEYNKIKDNNIMYASTATNGGTSAIQVVNNVKPVVSNNTTFTDLTNKPTYGVELMSTTSGATALNNVVVGSTGSAPNRDWNTTTPNNMQTLSKIGTETFSAGGTLGSYTFAHGLNPMTPKRVDITMASADAGTAGLKYVTADATNIYVYFGSVPVAGTNNITFTWEAKL